MTLLGINKASGKKKKEWWKNGGVARCKSRRAVLRTAGAKGSQENISPKKVFIGDELLSHIIQCFLKAISLTGLSSQQTKGTFLHLHTLRCHHNTETQGYRARQRLNLPKALQRLTDKTTDTALLIKMHLRKQLPHNGTVSSVRPPHHPTWFRQNHRWV